MCMSELRSELESTCSDVLGVVTLVSAAVSQYTSVYNGAIYIANDAATTDRNGVRSVTVQQHAAAFVHLRQQGRPRNHKLISDGF
ncbi:hypothetical protein C0Q70_06133 [Pomacea canaliculata]|uniref:Uncharacterized protein n=1 Tax=Pomacea canaliculata TaxID=400727 RepID=A0A2T7PN57_POMCA|nr:hypothetical protein C0Q70_06133 [Pomacea canaliculata]